MIASTRLTIEQFLREKRWRRRWRRRNMGRDTKANAKRWEARRSRRDK